MPGIACIQFSAACTPCLQDEFHTPKHQTHQNMKAQIYTTNMTVQSKLCRTASLAILTPLALLACAGYSSPTTPAPLPRRCQHPQTCRRRLRAGKNARPPPARAPHQKAAPKKELHRSQPPPAQPLPARYRILWFQRKLGRRPWRTPPRLPRARDSSLREARRPARARRTARHEELRGVLPAGRRERTPGMPRSCSWRGRAQS
jgi:hypothetical protein